MTHPYHTDIRLQLLAHGYVIIPSRGKVPAIVGWNDQDYAAQQLTSTAKGSAAERVARWEKRFPDAVSTGVRIENGLSVIDGDIDDPLADRWLDAVREIAPQVLADAPMRYGGGPHKCALFCQVEGERWVHIASKRYNGHRVEIFGGAPLRSGKCSRQFGIYGPHSFNADGTVARTYEWTDDVAPLTARGTGGLPRLTKAQGFAIAAAFERLAQEAGWQVEETPQTEGGEAVYDITDATRFDTSTGETQISYTELCDLQEMHTELRCASNFMAGREGTDRSRCWVFHSPRHDCTAVWVYGDEQAHFPKSMEPAAVEADIAPLLSAAMAAAGVEPPPDTPNWRERYANGGGPKASLHNATLAIVAAGFLCSFDVFHNRLFLGRGGAPLPFCGEVTDHGVMGLRVWLSNAYGLDFTEKHVRDAVTGLAIERQFNPVTDMLAEAEANWDGIKRLDRMAADYFNAEDTELNRQCVRKTMIAAVARARRPGCKFDTILVMESPEGYNKSSAWAVLAGEGNFSDERIIGHASREVQEQLAGIWIHESADLAGMKKAEVEIVKAFASRVEDRARPAYGHFLVAQPRHSIEVGTTNSDRYLHAPTGNRRFWPMVVQRHIDLAKLKAHRLQLWGEAAAAQTAGESITLDERLWAAAGVEQEARRVPHPWEAVLAGMSSVLSGVITQTGDEERVSTRDIFKEVLKIPEGHMHRGHAMTLAEAMKVLGWEHKLFRTKDGVTKGYVRTVTKKVS